jgi:glutathione S-transferase
MVPLVDGNACNFYNVATTITSRLHLARLSFTGARARARVSAFQPRSHAGSDRARSNPLRKVPAANPAGRDCIHYSAIINFWFAQTLAAAPREIEDAVRESEIHEPDESASREYLRNHAFPWLSPIS